MTVPNAAWIALGLTPHLGGKKLAALLNTFGQDPDAVLAANSTELQRVPGIGPKIAASIRAIDLTAIQQAIPRWLDAGVTVLLPNMPNFPESLRTLSDAPALLFVRGLWPLAPGRMGAIVGTRQPAEKSRLLAQRWGAELAEHGWCVVSGLAHGIDTAAHYGALAVPSGQTLAVLGGGVLNIYPSENRSLAEAILRRGAILSETHPFLSPSPSALVARNRLISGLSDILIVVETSIDGGAMYAARRAFEQGRTVFVLDSPASGNRALLAEGAMPLAPDRPLMDFLPSA